MFRIRLVVAVAALAFIAMPAWAQTPLDSKFTYQGRLKDGGQSADGTYDLRFRLFNVASGGSALATYCVDGVAPVDGLFTAEVDFGGAAFDGNNKWLEIGVRADATAANCGGGAYTILTTRQPLTAMPYALYALDGPTADYWTKTGLSLHNTVAGNFVGINRSTQVSANEYFGIQAPVQSGFGGMYIRTDGDAGWPFYGYRAGTDSAWHYLDGNTGTWNLAVAGTTRMTVMPAGNVGLGTATPAVPLHINRGLSGANVRVQNGADYLDISPNSINTEGDGFLGDPLYLNNTSTSSTLIGFGGGRCGIGGGTAGLPLAPLHVDGGTDAVVDGLATGYVVIGASNGANIVMDNNEIMARNDGAVSTLFLNHNGGDVQIGQGSAGTGKIVTPVIQITGGADLPENFDVSTTGDFVAKPGMVVCIDTEKPGRLIPCTRAYDKTVAGVISGAGGVKPGMLMGQKGSIADGSHPVALTGRVYVMCDASTNAIEPGDMLTTSDVAGHAMKVSDHGRAQGAIIGKAMSPLVRGNTGLVLVLVNLQ